MRSPGPARGAPHACCDPGDIVRVRIVELDADGAARLALEQAPPFEAALVALEPTTGAVRALVGGLDFERSEFDRAIQARRQTGSAFKPFVYAAALARGFTLADRLLDEPTVFLDRSNPVPYQPENYTNEYYETVTLRTALEKSANIATVRLLTEIGYTPVLDLARSLGITSPLEPYPSLALGAFEISLLELTAAYGTFANQGVLVEPHLVERGPRPRGRARLDRDPGRARRRPARDRVPDEPGAGGRDHRRHGPRRRVPRPRPRREDRHDRRLHRRLVHRLLVRASGRRVGRLRRAQEPRPRETGAMAALPIWTRFMQQAYEGRDTPEFPVPAGMTVVAIDRQTGLKANRDVGCSDVISESFIVGTEPTRYCTAREHALAGFPYPFRRYAIDDDGALAVPSNELERLLAEETDVYLVEHGTRLEAHTPRGVFTLPLAVLAPVAEPERADWIRERFDPDTWRGRDGRRARVVVLE